MIGPDLSCIGDQSAEQHDYTRMSGVKTVLGWHLAHFKDPKSRVSTTVMPDFGLNTHDAQSVALLVMSWKRTQMPVEYIPGAETLHLGGIATAD